MEHTPKTIRVYFETGDKKTFAGAVDWPGWCRSGKNEKSALQTLFDYKARYAQAIHTRGIDFPTPASLSDFTVLERLKGNVTTDFGAPAIAPSVDVSPISDSELDRIQKILESCWDTFEAAVKSATGRQLRLGPRGGGRDLEKIARHVLDADAVYLAKISWKQKPIASADLIEASTMTRQAVLDALSGTPGKMPGQDKLGESFGRNVILFAVLPGTCWTTPGKSKIELYSALYQDQSNDTFQ